jgi:hypothetical protein
MAYVEITIPKAARRSIKQAENAELFEDLKEEFPALQALELDSEGEGEQRENVRIRLHLPDDANLSEAAYRQKVLSTYRQIKPVREVTLSEKLATLNEVEAKQYLDAFLLARFGSAVVETVKTKRDGTEVVRPVNQARKRRIVD